MKCVCIHMYIVYVIYIHSHVLQGLSHIGGRNRYLNLSTFIFLLFYCVVKIFSNAFLMEQYTECFISSG